MAQSAGHVEGQVLPFSVPLPLEQGPQHKGQRLPRLQAISRIVNQVVASWHSPLALAEQRGWQRIRYDRPAILTLLDDRGHWSLGIHKVVSGRDISPSGFSFTHLDPLACRRVIVTFAFEPEETEAIELKLTWCRFTRAGIYQSGGKFVNPTPSPLPRELILDELPYA
jgi:hypothetical protein